jgi:histidinol-phosphate aminotransferase
VLPPYAFPSPCEAAVLAALDPAARGAAEARQTMLVAERSRLADGLAALPAIRRVWPSEANFLLVAADEPAKLLAAAQQGGVLIRDFSDSPWTRGCLRITVGLPAENDQLLAALATVA